MSRFAFAAARTLLTLALAALAAGGAQAGFPERPVTLVVPYPPGGAADVLGRIVARHLPAFLPGATVVVDNKAGAPFYLVLDQVQDPHNLGACLRTADAVGAHGVIVTKDNAAGITPTVCKVASGAAETVPVYQVTNLARVLRWLKEQNVWIMGAAGEAEQTVFQMKLDMPLAIVMGAEGTGMRHLTRQHCDFLVKIPMAGQVESLNVSVAAGVLMYEVFRQKQLA